LIVFSQLPLFIPIMHNFGIYFPVNISSVSRLF